MSFRKLSTLLISAVMSVVLVGNSVYAITGSNFFTSNGIHMYDPSGTAAAAQSCAAGTGGNLVGDTVVQKAFLYFVSKGLTTKQAAGVLGNLIVESGGGTIDPKSHQDGGGIGRGIAQWSVNGRWVDLLAFAQKDGRSEWDLGLQLDFLWHELNDVAPWNQTLAPLKASTTITDATRIFMEKFEKPGIPHFDQRLGYANDTYNRYAASAGSATPNTGTPAAPGCGLAGGSVVAIAQAELAKGVLENPIGCDAGNPSVKGDCGVEVNKYTDGMLEFWCADFVSWVYRQAGTPFTGGASGGWRIANVGNVMAWFNENGEFFNNGATAAPKPGDAVSIGNGEHIGIVEKIVGNDLYVFSGNTSTANFSNGVGVGRAIYKNFRTNPMVDSFGGLR